MLSSANSFINKKNVFEFSIYCSGTGTPNGLGCLTLLILIYCCTQSLMVTERVKILNDLRECVLATKTKETYIPGIPKKRAYPYQNIRPVI